jgi:hypothetical protein
MHSSHYQPKRSQQLYLVEKLREKLNYPMDEIVVHHVLEDSPSKLFLQIERRAISPFGFTKIIFERVSL